MQQPFLVQPKDFVRDLADGQAIDSVFVVRELSRKYKRNGDPYLKLRLSDVTGAVEAVAWDGIEDMAAHAKTGAIVKVSGSYSVDSRYGPSLTVRSLRCAETGEYDPTDLHEGPQIAYSEMDRRLDELIQSVTQPALQQLLYSVFDSDSSVGDRWRNAPAAKFYHQAYQHGLLEHCILVAEGVSAACAIFGELDRDLAVSGALLHDVGKVEAYETDGVAIELTDAGKLQGEIALGYYLVRREIEAIADFPPQLAQALLHIILAHHGQLAHGSPVVPCTREATLVHMIDNLGGRLGSFDRLEKTLSDGECWSGFDRALQGSAYFLVRDD
jgi:3'-5' exoribonuclease